MEDQVCILKYTFFKFSHLKHNFKSIFIPFTSGLWGLIAAGLFKADGLLRSGNVNMLIWNVIGAACIMVWHATCSAILFITLKKLGLFRIPSKLEQSGLDEIYHREPAYRFSSRRGDLFSTCIST